MGCIQGAHSVWLSHSWCIFIATGKRGFVKCTKINPQLPKMDLNLNNENMMSGDLASAHRHICAAHLSLPWSPAALTCLRMRPPLPSLPVESPMPKSERRKEERCVSTVPRSTWFKVCDNLFIAFLELYITSHCYTVNNTVLWYFFYV